MREFSGFMKGIDLGGWLSQCGEENYNDNHYSTFITESDIEAVSKMGLDHVRLPFDYNVIMDDSGEFIPSGFAYIDNAVAWCRKRGLAIVLDLHKTAGFVFDDASCCQFFTDRKLQEMFFKLWTEMAKRYGNADDIAFELLNEITDPNTAQKWNELAAEAVQAIRAVTKTTRIIIGGIFNSSIYGMTLLDRPADENIVFTFHCYSPLVFTHQNAYWVAAMPKGFSTTYPQPEKQMYELSHSLFGNDYDAEFDKENTENISSKFFDRMFAEAVRIAEEFNVPLYCGEYGVIDQADPESTLCWFSDIHEAFVNHKIARAVWTYKEKDYGLIGEHYAPIFDRLVEKL